MSGEPTQTDVDLVLTLIVAVLRLAHRGSKCDARMVDTTLAAAFVVEMIYNDVPLERVIQRVRNVWESAAALTPELRDSIMKAAHE